jgi:hypothetical protein
MSGAENLSPSRGRASPQFYPYMKLRPGILWPLEPGFPCPCIHGKDLYRVAPLGEIIGSAHKIYLQKLQKNLKLVYKIPMGYNYSFQKKNQLRSPSIGRETKMTNSIVNSVSFRCTLFIPKICLFFCSLSVGRI